MPGAEETEFSSSPGKSEGLLNTSDFDFMLLLKLPKRYDLEIRAKLKSTCWYKV